MERERRVGSPKRRVETMKVEMLRTVRVRPLPGTVGGRDGSPGSLHLRCGGDPGLFRFSPFRGEEKVMRFAECEDGALRGEERAMRFAECEDGALRVEERVAHFYSSAG